MCETLGDRAHLNYDNCILKNVLMMNYRGGSYAGRCTVLLSHQMLAVRKPYEKAVSEGTIFQIRSVGKK